MADCAQDLKRNILVDCENPLARGLDETVRFGRFRNLASHTADSTNKKILTGIVLKSGEKLTRYKGINYSNNATVGFTSSEYGNLAPQGLRIIIFSNDPDDEAELDAMMQMKDLFAIVRKNGNPGVYKVYGWKTGLRMTNLASDTNDETLKGAYAIDLSAPDEKTTPYTLRVITASADTTEEYLEAMTLADPT